MAPCDGAPGARLAVRANGGYPSLGVAWFNLVQQTVEEGVSPDGECLEILGAQVAFRAESEGDEVIRRFGDGGMIAEMERVFFADGPNALGPSYAKLMRGPSGQSDLADVVSLLRAEPASKRGVVTLCGAGNGKVPCVNVIQFLVRGGSLNTTYFARGQDAYNKFYADALCLGKMARRVAAALNVPAKGVVGFIGSSHVYYNDQPAIADFLARARDLLESGEYKGDR